MLAPILTNLGSRTSTCNAVCMQSLITLQGFACQALQAGRASGRGSAYSLITMSRPVCMQRPAPRIT